MAYTLFGVVVFLVGSAAVYTAVPRIRDARGRTGCTPSTTPQGQGFQLVQSLYALAEGGVIGPGLGRASWCASDGPTVVPALQTDFMFTAVASELGYIGGGRPPARLPGADRSAAS